MYSNQKKKQRGQQRELRRLLNRIDQYMDLSPSKLYDGAPYVHFHVPSGMFIEHPKTSGPIKTAFCRKWVAVAERLIAEKEPRIPFCKVVAMLSVPNLWSSQLILFYDAAYYHDFWKRNDPFQIWKPITDCLSFAKTRCIQTPLSELGIHETLIDEDGNHFEDDLWFYGDVPLL